MENWLPALLIVLSLSQIKAKPLESILPQDSEEIQFQVQDCSGITGDKLNIQSFNGGTPTSCRNAKIYEDPVPTPAQIMSLPDRHPVKFVNCRVHIRAFTGMCDVIDQVNGRNINLFGKMVYDGYYAPDPIECFKANKTGSLTFQTPVIGGYPGEKVTEELVTNTISGTIYPYGEPGKINCLGATWVDQNQNIQTSATLEIQYVIEFKNV